ncbi:MAG TPA: SpoIIE family protein phosphatase [Acidimicrobiales bacterium]|nr:SpoIIE family protein phosphatase [Acidimicrobiales bacterium]
MVAVALVACALGAADAWNAWRSIELTRVDNARFVRAVDDAAALQLALTEEARAARDLVATHSPMVLADVAAAERDARARLASLRGEVAGYPALVRALGRIDEANRRWAEAVASLAARSRGAVALPPLPSAQAGALHSSLATLRDRTAREVERQGTTTFWVAVGAAAGAVVIAVGGWLALSRWVNDPIELLASEAREVASGNVDRPIRAVGPPELAALGADVEDMRVRLRDEAAETRHVRAALLEHSPLQVLLEAELGPSARPTGLEIAARLIPAQGTLAGDWYDAWQLRPGLVGLALVDVSGNGAAAGLFALHIKHLLRAALRLGLAPGAAIDWVAGQLGDTGERFATAVVLDVSSEGRCRYANAGHPASLHVHDGGIDCLAPTGPLLGPFPGTWATRALALRPGDELICYTDGLSEAVSDGGERLGTEGLVSLVAALGRHARPAQVLDSLLAPVRRADRSGRPDDVTLVVARYEGA